MTSLNTTGELEDSPAKPVPSAWRFRPVDAFFCSVWAGLTAGTFEVLIVIVRKQFVDWNQLYWMTRHFVWLVPLTNLILFTALGLLLALITPWGRWGGRLALRVLASFFWLPLVWSAFPLIYGPAGLILAVGIGVQTGGFLEKHLGVARRLAVVSWPVILLVPLGFMGWIWGGDAWNSWREQSRPLPPPGSPNVLLIVLDTVAAEHLSLYGYSRPTSPTLSALAGEGVDFRHAVAPSSWTLPSHASFFTGRWPHELSAGWLTPLDRSQTTLAEVLSARGYATAGFVANNWYCAADSGLSRGFTVYRDHLLEDLAPFKNAVLIDRPLEGARSLDFELRRRLGIGVLRPLVSRIWWLFNSSGRKDAAQVNSEFRDWLDTRSQPQRPFFAFLNYYDAHHPYELPQGGIHRYGTRPRNDREVSLIQDWRLVDKQKLAPQEIEFVRDSYDDCVAALDEHLGRLLDELNRRRLTSRTWLIVISDHGEGFGEHPADFGHGTTLYHTQLHVPFLIVPPKGQRIHARIDQEVSLRDLPATILDILGVQVDELGGHSLAGMWRSRPGDQPPAPSPALAEVVPTDPVEPDVRRLMDSRQAWGSLTEDGWVYMEREGMDAAELYDLHTDPGEHRNRWRDPTQQTRLARMREKLRKAAGGPLTRDRFRP